MDRRSGRSRREIDYASLFVVALFAIMLIGIMVLSAMAGSLFDSITENRTDNMNRRGALSYTASKIIASDEEGMTCSNDGQTEMKHNGPVDCLLHRSGQTSTEPGRNDIGAKAAISFLVNRLVRMEGLSSFHILRREEYEKRSSPDIRTRYPRDGDYISSSKVIRPE